MKKLVVVLGVVVTSLSCSVVAGDAAKGKEKSATCAACHGTKGKSPIPMYPHLAGQNAQYLELQLKAFRDGTRKNMVMGPNAAGLSDEDIANISAYYAGLDPKG